MGGNTMQPLANITPLKPAGAVEVRNVGQIFKTTTQDVIALEDVSLDVKPGRFVVLVGPSGCGKSTLLMMMAGLRQQKSGTITTTGAPIQDREPHSGAPGFPDGEPFPGAGGGRDRRFPAGVARFEEGSAPRQGAGRPEAGWPRRLRQ